MKTMQKKKQKEVKKEAKKNQKNDRKKRTKSMKKIAFAPKSRSAPLDLRTAIGLRNSRLTHPRGVGGA